MPGKWKIEEIAAVDGDSSLTYTYTLNDYEGYCFMGVAATVSLGVSATAASFYLESKHPLEGGYQRIDDAGGNWAFGFSAAADMDIVQLEGSQTTLPSRPPIPPSTNFVVKLAGIAGNNKAYAHLFVAKPFGG
jgi:hypothetical protein